MISRNSEGIVSAGDIQFKIPKEHSMLGVMSLNKVINRGEYRDDGLVYVNDVPVRRWFGSVAGVRVWEPRLTNLKDLYRIYHRVKVAHSKQWGKIAKILERLWKTPGTVGSVKAHYKPTSSSDLWWEYNVYPSRNPAGGLAFSSGVLEEKPEVILNEQLGEELYQAEKRAYSLAMRLDAIWKVFFEMLYRAVEPATDKKLICFKFEADTFWFETYITHYGDIVCKMFDGDYQLEVRDMKG